MNPTIGSRFRFKDLVDRPPTTEPQAPNEFTVTAVDGDSVHLLQAGSSEPTDFSRSNFERDFEPIPEA